VLNAKVYSHCGAHCPQRRYASASEEMQFTGIYCSIRLRDCRGAVTDSCGFVKYQCPRESSMIGPGPSVNTKLLAEIGRDNMKLLPLDFEFVT